MYLVTNILAYLFREIPKSSFPVIVFLKSSPSISILFFPSCATYKWRSFSVDMDGKPLCHTLPDHVCMDSALEGAYRRVSYSFFFEKGGKNHLMPLTYQETVPISNALTATICLWHTFLLQQLPRTLLLFMQPPYYNTCAD